MCGIVAVVSRPGNRAVPSPDDLLSGLDRAATALSAEEPAARRLQRASVELEGVDGLVRGVPGVLALAGHTELAAAITARLDGLDSVVQHIEAGARSWPRQR